MSSKLGGGGGSQGATLLYLTSAFGALSTLPQRLKLGVEADIPVTLPSVAKES